MPSEVLFFIIRILSILTHTHGEGEEGFLETDNGVYPKGPVS